MLKTENTKRWSSRLVLIVAMLLAISARAMEEMYEQTPMNYSASQPQDAITRLRARLADGAVKLGGRDREFVSGLLRELDISVESQVVVFSKTSFQRSLINPDRPRAIYFSDDCYIGWVPSGFVEIITVDPKLGPVFYSLDPTVKPANVTSNRFVRDSDCLRCHGGTFVRGIPGVFVRSLHTDQNGEPLLKGGSEVVDFRTPFTERWGGWYVTGKHGRALHRGNVFTQEKGDELMVDFKRGANVTDLARFFDTDRYLTNSSDIVALLVLEHQTAMQNTITRAGMNCRRMLDYQQALQRGLKESSTEELAYASVRSVFEGAVREIVDDLLFYKEAQLPDGLEGSPAFQHAFQKNARRSTDGHSLKAFSLKGQLFKNRCSYLIYSDSFLALPPQLTKRVYARLEQILKASDPEPRYSYLGSGERMRIAEILRETHSEYRSFLAAQASVQSASR